MNDTRKTIDATELVSTLAALEYREGKLDAYLNGVATAFSRLLGIDWAVVTLSLDADSYAVIGNSDSLMDMSADDVFSLHGTVANKVMTSGEPLCVEDWQTCIGCGDLPPGYVAYLGMPLKTPSGNTIGTLCSFHKSARSFGSQDVDVARVFAERAAAVIDNYRAYQELAKLNKNLEGVVRVRTAELMAVQESLIRQERLAAIGEFAAKTIHELRSPLSTIMIALDYLANETLGPGAEKRLVMAAEESNRLQKLLREILDYANPSSELREPVNLCQLLQEIVATFEAASSVGEARRTDVQLSCTGEAVHVLANPDKLKQVFINLLDNALDAAPPGETVGIAASVEDSARAIRVEVLNPAVAPESFDVMRAREPFYTTKPGGTGLGLAIVEGILDTLEGEFDIARLESGEVLAQVTLPLVGGVADL